MATKGRAPASTKRQKERSRAEKRQMKAEKKERRRAEKEAKVTSPSGGEDADIAGIVPGPQPQSFED